MQNAFFFQIMCKTVFEQISVQKEFPLKEHDLHPSGQRRILTWENLYSQ